MASVGTALATAMRLAGPGTILISSFSITGRWPTRVAEMTIGTVPVEPERMSPSGSTKLSKRPPAAAKRMVAPATSFPCASKARARSRSVSRARIVRSFGMIWSEATTAPETTGTAGPGFWAGSAETSGVIAANATMRNGRFMRQKPRAADGNERDFIVPANSDHAVRASIVLLVPRRRPCAHAHLRTRDRFLSESVVRPA